MIIKFYLLQLIKLRIEYNLNLLRTHKNIYLYTYICDVITEYFAI